MIDSIKPEDISRAIRQYKNGGAVMPNDVKLDLADFQEELKRTDLNESDRQSFESAVNNILSKYPAELELDMVDVESRSINYLTGGNWYKQYPEKLLGEILIDKDMRGNEIQVLKGTLADLNKIVFESDLKQLQKDLEIGVSAIKDSIDVDIDKPATAEFVESIIAKSNVNIGKKAVRKKKNEEQNVNSDFTPKQLNIKSFQTVFEEQNKSISVEELRAYVWYKEQINQRLSLDWYKMAFGDEQPYKTIDETQIKQWVIDGVLFYFDGDLLPLPIYASGNLYDKISRIVKSGNNSGQDIETIISKYGNQALQEHLRVINDAFKTVYDGRLVITGNSDANSLILKPASKFAKSFMIENTLSFEEFRWYQIGRKENYGRPDFKKTGGRGYKRLFDNLSLTDAFCLWLVVNRDKLEIKGNITYWDIIYLGIDKRTYQTPSGLKDKEAAEFQRNLLLNKASAVSEGNRLFLTFLKEELSLNQKVAVETQWNSSFNNYRTPNYDKIPVAFNVTNNFFGEEPFVIKPEKREAVSFLFNEGCGCLAYDVGVGKSISAIFSIEQFITAGYSKRPFIVVPNQTYKQWLSEIRNAMPQRKVNGLYNLGNDYRQEILDENNEIRMVEEGSISVMTYEGFKQLGFNEKTQSQLMDSLTAILTQTNTEKEQSQKSKAKEREKYEKLVGKGLKGTNIEIESLGFDLICFDEAHALKNLFVEVKGEQQEGKKGTKKQYSIQGGSQSDLALKGFMMCNYILKNNNYRNVFMLTATPFTNSPLEVYSMLSLMAYHHLEKLGVLSITDFFDNYINVTTELVITHKLTPQYKQIVKGFNNLPALQKIIFRFFNFKSGESVGVERPNKYVIPYTKVMVNGSIVNLPEKEQVTCYIEMNDIQKDYMDDIIAYAEGKAELGYSSSNSDDDEIDEIEGELKDSESQDVDEGLLTDNEKAGVRAIKSMNFSRNLALSPYLYKYNTLGKPTYQDYIETSPKLQYVMECIKSVKKYHEDHNEPISGQVIYMDRGLIYFNLIKDYLIYEVGYSKHEVGIISGGMSPEQKRKVQDAFNGEKFNEKLKESESISDDQRMKVLIGSSSIREGMNLQKKATVLYNCFVDWNPTDFLQVSGRIHRQKNQFANVRIVNPLVIDSMDIFMFQKLEEKSARINDLLTVNGKSALKTEELDTEEVKFALIKDPRKLAAIEVETKAITLRDEINSIKVINDRLKNYQSSIATIYYYEDNIEAELRRYDFNKSELDIFGRINFLLNLYKAQYPKDGEGRVMTNYQTHEKFTQDAKNKDAIISPHQKPDRPYWFKYVIEPKRLIDKEDKDLLTVRNIKRDYIKEYTEKSEQESKNIQVEIDNLKSDDYIRRRSQEIEEYRRLNKIEVKSISELLTEFERLNYLLSIKMFKKAKQKIEFVYEKSIFLDENGKRLIDDVTIEKLTEGLSSLPQTKDLYIDESGDYVQDRKLLHYEIINDIKRNLNCIESDSPLAILTGGSPASGKSTFLRTFAPFLLSNEIMKIDADEIRAKLPEYEGWNASATHLETKDIVNTLLTDNEIGIPCKFDVIYDGTMNSTKNYLPLIGLLHSLGYKIFIVYMDNIPYDVIKDRMLKRYQNSGRFVPIEVIDDFFSKGKQALNELKDKVEGYVVIDASSKDYEIIEEGGMKLPTSRNYSQLGKPIKTASLIDKLIEATKLLTNV